MKIEGYRTLLKAAFDGDSPGERLINLLFAIREVLFAEDKDSVEIWITSHPGGEIQDALIYLQKDSVEQKPENICSDKNINKKEKPSQAAHTIEILIPTESQPKIAGYLHFSLQPRVVDEWLESAVALVGRMVLEVRREQTEEIIYSILNLYREQMFEANKPLGQKILENLGKDVAKAFCVQSLWVMVYDFQNWRNRRGKPLVAYQGQEQPFAGREKEFSKLLKKKVYKLLEQADGNLQSIGQEIDLSDLSPEFGERRFYIAAAPLAAPKKSDDDAGIPYIAVVTLDEPGHNLDAQEKGFLKKFVLEMQRVLRYRDEIKHVKGMVGLLQEFLCLSTPGEVANSVVKYFSKMFSATEAAVLERRGMFLSVIGQKGVPVQAIPPLHIMKTDALVCEVAQSEKESYDADVRDTGKYLPIVFETKSQFTVPLIWRGDLVGVLLIGLPVLDGLEDRHLKIVRALAGYCAAAIAGSQRTAEERAVSHMLGEVLTGAALKIYQINENRAIDAALRDKLKSTFDLLNQCQVFIENFRKAQSSANRKKRLDLRKVVAKSKDNPLVGSVLEESECTIKVKSFPKPLFAEAYEEGLKIALYNIILNGVEAMEDTPGQITVSIDVSEPMSFQASRRDINFAIIKIADEGKGISKSEEIKIFEPFYTSKQNHLGTGLHIAERIIEGFGGRIRYCSPARESGKGSEFALWIPLIEEKEFK